jgi:hypothetical protein
MTVIIKLILEVSESRGADLQSSAPLCRLIPGFKPLDGCPVVAGTYLCPGRLKVLQTNPDLTVSLIGASPDGLFSFLKQASW